MAHRLGNADPGPAKRRKTQQRCEQPYCDPGPGRADKSGGKGGSAHHRSQHGEDRARAYLVGEETPDDSECSTDEERYRHRPAGVGRGPSDAGQNGRKYCRKAELSGAEGE